MAAVLVGMQVDLDEPPGLQEAAVHHHGMHASSSSWAMLMHANLSLIQQLHCCFP